MMILRLYLKYYLINLQNHHSNSFKNTYFFEKFSIQGCLFFFNLPTTLEWIQYYYRHYLR